MDDLIGREKLLEALDELCSQHLILCGDCLLADAKTIIEEFSA